VQPSKAAATESLESEGASRIAREMTAHRVALIIPAQGIDTSASNPASQLQLNILMAVAEFEREIIRDRVNAGLRAACTRGARLADLRRCKNICRVFGRCVKRATIFSHIARIDAALQQHA
jgi:DNA invertase Pin-like site-specific DNA recombinase